MREPIPRWIDCGCDGGRITGGHPNDPSPPDYGPCRVCGGRGAIEIEPQPIEMEDLPDFECEDCIGMREHGCYCKAMGCVAPGQLPKDQEANKPFVDR
jgi:hypothetical protein